MTTRKPLTKDSSIARLTTGRVPGCNSFGSSAPASLFRWVASASRAEDVSSISAKRWSSRRSKLCSITIPKTAIASNPAVREIALLIPDATPTRFEGTEFITVVVRGATLTAIPSPRTTIAGKKVVQ